eukprot:g8635.t1
MLSSVTRTCKRLMLEGLYAGGIARQCHRHSATENSGAWNADVYSKEAKSVFEGASHVVDLLQPQPGERILDLGCGSGELTLTLKNAGTEVVAVDNSLSMVEAAKEKGAYDIRNVNGYDLEFNNEFDAVFSHMAIHWMHKDPRKVVSNVFNALKEGGRFVAAFCGKGTGESFTSPLLSILKRHGLMDTPPLYLPPKEEYAALLQLEGLELKHISLLPREIVIPGGPRMVLDFYTLGWLQGLDDAKKEQIYNEFERVIDRKRIDEKGGYAADVMELALLARKPV